MSNLKTRVLGKAQLSNHSNYNAFDLSHRNCFTNSTGNICPVAVMDILPTEKVSLNIGWFSRAQTLISNSYGRFVENVQAFYVPYSSIYRNYSQNALTSALSNANGDNECRISDGLGVSQPLNDGKLPRLDMSEVWEYLWFLSLYEEAYSLYAMHGNILETKGPTIPILSRSFMTRSTSVALLLEQLGYGSFSVFTDPKYRMETPLPLSAQPGFDMERVVFSPLNFEALKLTDADAIKDWWKRQRDAYNVFASPMHLFAYHKVYNDYYRNDSWQPYESETCNCDYLFQTSSKTLEIPYSREATLYPQKFDELIDDIITAFFQVTDFASASALLSKFDVFFKDSTEQKQFFTDYNLFDPRCCNLPLDAVNGVLPEPQYGNASEVQINTFNLDPSVNPTSTRTLIYQGEGTAPYSNAGKLAVMRESDGVTNAASLKFSIRDMRIAESLQKFKEISLSNDNYFVEQLKAHFGEAPTFDPFKTYFIGGKSTIMQVDTQVNNNLADENATLGGIASAQGSFTANYKADDYGCVIVLHSLYPIIDYPNDGIDESVLCVTADSLPVPEFDNNGFEGVRNIFVRGLDPKNYTLAFSDEQKPLGVYGYGARYWSWKTAKDVINGDFKYTIRDKVMGVNPLSAKYGILENALVATPLLTDHIFANTHHSQVSDDQFYTNMQVGVSVLRPFSVHGLPFAN